MGVNFSPFDIGRRALHAAQLGLTVAGQNIANVNTPGYSRQSVLLSASPSDGSNLRLVGTGVTIDGVRQFRDQFVDSRLQTETGITGRLTAQRDALSPVDEALNESDGGGINAAINTFFGSFQALETNPNSLPLRTDVVSKANSLTATFTATRARLVGIRSDADQQLRSEVDHLNELTQRVADLNVRISTAENSGSSASELRDLRGEVVKEVAELTGARSIENQDGMVTLTIGDGQALVSGSHATSLQVQDMPDGLAAVLLNGQPAAIADGRLRGLMDSIKTIGDQIGALDDLAASISARVNALHVSGTDRAGNSGRNFFSVPASGPITAANFSVDSAIKADPNRIVASPLAAGSASATIAGAIGALLTDPSSSAGARIGSFSSIYASIVSDAGTSVKVVNDALTIQQAILNQATAQRDAVSGVSLDEEAINMLQFQKSYEAAARFLRIADDMTRTIMSLGQ